MQKITDAVGDRAMRNAAQLARVTRLIRLITEIEDQSPSDTGSSLSGAGDQPQPVFSGQDSA